MVNSVEDVPGGGQINRSSGRWYAAWKKTLKAKSWRGTPDVLIASQRCEAGGDGESYEKTLAVERWHWPKKAAEEHGTMSTFNREAQSMILTLEEARELHRQLGLALGLDGNGRA
jgi:hypothetical protein